MKIEVSGRSEEDLTSPSPDPFPSSLLAGGEGNNTGEGDDNKSNESKSLKRRHMSALIDRFRPGPG